MAVQPPTVPKPHCPCKRKPKTFHPYNARYRKNRKVVMAATPICAWCQKAFSEVTHHIDHDSTNHAPENLVAICQACHIEHHKIKQ